MSVEFKPTGSWVALVTPMDGSGDLDRAALTDLVQRHRRCGTSGIVVAGTTGESAALDDDELAVLFDTVIEAADGRIPVMAGVGSPATHKAVRMAHIAQRAGADAMLCVTPYYLKTTQQGLYAHYRALTEAVDLPIVLYNVPGRTAVDLKPETTARLAQLPSIVAIKEAVPELARIEQLVAQCPAGFRILSGDDASCLRTMRAGGDGVISVTANVVPSEMAQLCRLATQGAWAEAEALQARLQPLHAMTMEEPNPMPVKALLHRLNRIGSDIRLPLLPASAELVDRMMALLDDEAFERL